MDGMNRRAEDRETRQAGRRAEEGARALAAQAMTGPDGGSGHVFCAETLAPRENS